MGKQAEVDKLIQGGRRKAGGDRPPGVGILSLQTQTVIGSRSGTVDMVSSREYGQCRSSSRSLHQQYLPNSGSGVESHSPTAC